jgi:hypothetical protein
VEEKDLRAQGKGITIGFFPFAGLR